MHTAPPGASGTLQSSLWVAALAALCLLLWEFATVRYNFGGDWTALFCTGGSQRVPPALEPGTYKFDHPHGYDGQFYRYIAHDLLFQKGYAEYVDDARLRYRRILVPLAAWVLAAGRPDWIDYAFIAVVLGSIVLGVYWSGAYVALRGRHPAWGLMFLLVPASLTSMDRMLVDATLAALFAGFLAAAERQSWRRLYILCMLACLARETGLLMAGAGVLYWLLQRRYADAVRFGTSVLPALAWWIFVAAQTAPSAASGLMAYPVMGVVQRLFTVRPIPDPILGTALQAIDVLAVLGLLGSFALAGYWAWRRRPGPAEIAVLLFLALGLVLGSPYYMLEAFGYGRPVSPLLLFVLLEAIRRRAWAAMAPPLLVTLSVGVFFASPFFGILQKLVS